ncbi:T9SS type A sorting domain-containing protein [Bacteroidota bacterium]
MKASNSLLRRKIITLIFLLFISHILLLAQNVNLQKDVFSSGKVELHSSSGNNIMFGTVGQPYSCKIIQGTNNKHYSGFWFSNKPSKIIIPVNPTTEVCKGGTVQIGIIDTVKGGIPPYTYSWYPANGLSSISDSLTMASPQKTQTYTITVTDSQGNKDSAKVNVIVHSLPQPLANDVTIISGDNATLIAEGPDSLEYTWFDSIISGDSLATGKTFITDTLTAQTEYFLEAKNLTTGCVNKPRLLVTVYIQGAITVFPINRSFEICEKDSIMIYIDSLSGGVPPYIYEWKPSNNLSSPNDSATWAKPTGTTKYRLKVTDQNNDSAFANVNVIVFPLPVPEINDTVILKGTSTTLTVTGPENCEIRWYNSQGTLIDSGYVFETVIMENDTSFFVEATDLNTSCITKPKKEVKITVTEVMEPFIRVVYPNGGERFCVGTEEIIQWESSNVTNVKISYSTDAGESWLEIDTIIDANAGKLKWHVPDLNSNLCLIRIMDVFNLMRFDKSDDYFTIETCGGEDCLTTEDVIITPSYIGNDNRREIVKFTNTYCEEGVVIDSIKVTKISDQFIFYETVPILPRKIPYRKYAEAKVEFIPIRVGPDYILMTAYYNDGKSITSRVSSVGIPITDSTIVTVVKIVVPEEVEPEDVFEFTLEIINGQLLYNLMPTDSCEAEISVKFDDVLKKPDHIKDNETIPEIPLLKYDTYRSLHKIYLPDDTYTMGKSILKLRSTAYLGSTNSATFTIDRFIWKNNEAVGLKIENSIMKIKVCEAGGARLLMRKDNGAAIQSIAPNPAREQIEITYSILDEKCTKLYITDIFGREIVTIKKGNLKSGEYTDFVDTKDMASGVYFVILDTPTIRKSQKVYVVK